MESNEEVHSDDGSFELINSDDYASETDHLNMEAIDPSSMEFSDDSSYDMLCSEVSDTLVLTEVKSSDEDVKSLSSESGNSDQIVENKTETDPELCSNSQTIPVAVKKGKKRDLMTMLCESSDVDMFNFPAQIKLINDMKEVAKNHIARYLPAKSLFKFKKVSKEWNNWISSPFFAHMQSQYFRKTSGFFKDRDLTGVHFYSLENCAYGIPDPSLGFLPVQVLIKSSCNGLLLCQEYNDENQLYICNPANKQWTRLPYVNYHGANWKIILGFEPSSLNFDLCYNIICMFSPLDLEVPMVEFVIYDSVTNMWRQSDMICTDLDVSVVKSDGIFVNGVVYWETTGGELLAFDLKNEIYSVQKLPVDDGSGELTNFDGEICYVIARYDYALRSCVLDVYSCGSMLLKNTINVPVDDVEDGEFVECEVLCNSCDDVVAFMVKVSQGQNRLYVYHVRDERVEGPKVFDHLSKLFPYVNSLVSIDA